MTFLPVPTVAESVDSVDGLLDALAETRRRVAAARADEMLLLARGIELTAVSTVGAVSSESDVPLRSLAAQIAAEARVSDRTVQRQLSDAVLMVSRFAATVAAWRVGEIGHAHVQVIVECGLPIEDDDARGVYEAAVLEVARRESASRLRPVARVLAERVHPVPFEARHAVAARSRDVWVRDLDDGMAELIASLPAVIAHGIRSRVDQLARAVIDTRAQAGRGHADGGAGGVGGDGLPGIDATGAGGADAAGSEVPGVDVRGVGEVRADVFADLVLTGHASAEASAGSIPEGAAIVGRVEVTVPVLTAVGADDAAATLTGRGPVDVATALRLAGSAPGWDRVMTHPVTGAVLAVDRYLPSEDLRRALRVRDEHCRFPGCRIPTGRCDIDHTVAREHDGPTELGNLAHLCRRHHTLKHHSAWRVRQDTDGTLHWTSPTGRTYPDTPARTLTFTTEPPHPPGVRETGGGDGSQGSRLRSEARSEPPGSRRHPAGGGRPPGGWGSPPTEPRAVLAALAGVSGAWTP